MYDYDLEIITTEKDAQHTMDPVIKHTLELKLVELRKNSGQDESEIKKLTDLVNKKQNQVMDHIEKIAKKAKKHLVLVPLMRPRIHKKPTIHPIAQQREGEVIPRESVEIEQIIVINSKDLEAVKHVMSEVHDTTVK